MARMRIRAKRGPIRAKKGPIRAKTKPAKMHAKPVNRYKCFPWKSQTIVAPYRGVSTNSFTLPRYLQPLTYSGVPTDKLGSSRPEYKQRESDLWENIVDALNRVKQVEAIPSYWKPFAGSRSKVRQLIVRAENALDKVVNTYGEWRQKKYLLHTYRVVETVTLSGVSLDIEPAGIREINWPLNEQLTAGAWFQNAWQVGTAGAKLEGHNDPTFAWVWDQFNSELSKDPVVNHQIFRAEQQGSHIDFDALYAEIGRPSWSSRRNAIKSIRNELKKAADAARCAQVWTAFVVSYAQNRQLWEKQQGDHSQTAGVVTTPSKYANLRRAQNLRRGPAERRRR